MSLDEFITLLSEDERATYDDLVTRGSDLTQPAQPVREALVALATEVCGREGKKPGAVIGGFIKAHLPKRPKPKEKPRDEVFTRLPYPLGMRATAVFRAWERKRAGESEPQLHYDLSAVMGIGVRVALTLGIQAYVNRGLVSSGDALNPKIVKVLRAPADGAMLSLAREIAKKLAKKDGAPLMAALHAGFGQKAVATNPDTDAITPVKGIKDAAQAFEKLVSFRNDLIHGERIAEDRETLAFQCLEGALRGLGFLADWELVVRSGERGFKLAASLPEAMDSIDESWPDKEPLLVHRDAKHAPLSLHPLLTFKDAVDDGDVTLDELFFINAGSLERLSYIAYRYAQHMDGKSLESYESFRDFLHKIPTPPIPKDPRIDFSALGDFHSRLFVGREDVLSDMADFIAKRPTTHGVLKALAGMGKTAIMATRYHAYVTEGGEVHSDEGPRCGRDPEGNRWVFHFCMATDGRNNPLVALRSLTAQVCDHFEIDRDKWLSQDLEELKDQRFPALLSQVSKSLEGDEKLVIAIDALDEGIGADKESIPSVIPSYLPEGVVVVMSYRVNDERQNSRVEAQLTQGGLTDAHMTIFASANPLAGLTRANADTFLDKLAQGREVTDATRLAVWRASTLDARQAHLDKTGEEAADESVGADPFFLRFIADGVEAQRIDLSRSESVPESLDDAFDEQWMSLPTEGDFLIHRVLCTLGIMREYGDDELFAALFNRERKEGQARIVPSDIARLRVSAGKLLVYDGDRYGLFHDRFRRYLVGEQKDPIAEALGMA
ncbi:MAG: hypothetical protein ACPGU1_10990 [Myxococcota bacterium]